MSTLHYRQRMISECIRRYVPMALPADKHGVRDTVTGQMVEGASYGDPELARTKCRTLAAVDIESHYVELMLTVLALLHKGDTDGAAKALTRFVQESGREA